MNAPIWTRAVGSVPSNISPSFHLVVATRYPPRKRLPLIHLIKSAFMQIKIFDTAAIPSIEDSDRVTEFAAPDSPEARRESYLARMAVDPQGGLRDVLVANSLTVRRVNELGSMCPNFSEVTGVIARAAKLSCTTCTELQFPPLLLVGPPGVGKTHFARKLAAALETPMVEQTMTNIDDQVLSGHSLSWRGARVGSVARTLIEGATASPLYVIDEIDKAQSVGHGDLLDPFHSLLEPENSAAFVDTFLETPIRADKILWVATANNLDIKPSILDRFLILQIDVPDDAERRAIISDIYEAMIRKYDSAFDPEMTVDAIDALADDSPRRMKMILNLAFGFAIDAQRRSLSSQDISAARRLAAAMSARQRIGFHTSLS